MHLHLQDRCYDFQANHPRGVLNPLPSNDIYVYIYIYLVISVLSILNMLHNPRFFLFKIPFIS
jgi:hypothetical protein